MKTPLQISQDLDKVIDALSLSPTAEGRLAHLALRAVAKDFDEWLVAEGKA